MWFLFALLSGFSAAVLAIIIKVYLKQFNPFFITFLFSIIMAIIIFMFDVFHKRTHVTLISSLTLKDWLPIILAGCLNGLAFTAYLTALKYGKASSVVALDRLGIVFVVVLSVFFLRESFTVKAVIGSLMMVAGTALISL